MSSLTKTSNGGWRYQLVCHDGKRRCVYFAKTAKKTAETLQSNFDRLAEAAKFKQTLDSKTQDWLITHPDEIKQKLGKLKLLKDSIGIPNSIHGFTAWYIQHYKPKKESRRKLENAASKLELFFGGETLLSDVTPGQAERFYSWLINEQELSENHARRTIGYAKQFFLAALNEELIRKQPFANLSARVKSNKARQFYIDLSTALSILEVCPDNTWKLRFVLMRWLGLRCASELNALKWSDVDWESGIIYVRDSKRAHHGEEMAIRPPAILPEVRQLLEQQLADAPEGAEFVLTRLAHKNYTKGLKKILKKAGVPVWPKLFNNLRASAITDALEYLPSHVVNEWFGNSEGISKEFYRMVTEDHYTKATGRVSQIVAQQASHPDEWSGTEVNNKLPKTQKTQQAADNSTAAGFTDWAMRDSNPRPPRCKRGALAN